MKMRRRSRWSESSRARGTKRPAKTTWSGSTGRRCIFAPRNTPESDVRLVVRAVSGDPQALAPAIKREVQALDPDQPVGQIATMEQNIATSLATRRLTMTLLAAFAGLALILASVGYTG